MRRRAAPQRGGPATLVLLGLLSIAALAAPALRPPAPRLLWNASASVPVGLYRIDPGATAGLGRIVAYRPTPAQTRLMVTRGYLPEGVPLLKPVAAAAPSVVCRRDRTILIDDRTVAQARRADRAGRPLPAWSGCRRLHGSEVFLLAPAAPDSLDGRYLGPVSRARIIGPATPLWLSRASR